MARDNTGAHGDVIFESSPDTLTALKYWCTAIGDLLEEITLLFFYILNGTVLPDPTNTQWSR